MKGYYKIIFVLLLLSTLISGVSPGSIPPKPTSEIFFQDYAKMFSKETKNYILSTSDEIRNKTTAEVAVVTIDSLNGNTIEEYANNLFRKWGIGNKEKNNGVLILISKNDRKFRIEVGYGLEGILPDGKTGSYLREMSSYFKSNEYDKGIATTYKRIIGDIGQEYNIDTTNYTKGVPDKIADDSTNNNGSSNLSSSNGESILKTIIVIVFLLVFFSKLRGRGGRGGGGYFYGGGGFNDSGFGGGSGGSDSFGGGDSGGGGSSGGW
ncbi:TPM domain-containing protein [Clostridium sp. C8-1-8]|uniref:TPM domain-containing protein n=1 Tax=Clostridium sp. C8-1-8 TaxID=2698831 RepID=UPI00136FC82A|nr:TPM domain-containing protein [Clostridium sp. C8-1-8]